MPTSPASCDADGIANSLYTSLTADAPTPPTIDFTDPKFSFTSTVSSELYKDLDTITLDQLTEGDLNGEGVFDKLMGAVDIHIKREFKDNRITGAEYAEVYTAVMGGVLSQSTLLGICFWREGRGNPGLAEYMGEKGGCGGKRGGEEF